MSKDDKVEAKLAYHKLLNTVDCFVYGLGIFGGTIALFSDNSAVSWGGLALIFILILHVIIKSAINHVRLNSKSNKE